MTLELTRRAEEWKHDSKHASCKTVGCQGTSSVAWKKVYQERENAREDKDNTGSCQSEVVQDASYSYSPATKEGTANDRHDPVDERVLGPAEPEHADDDQRSTNNG